MPGQRGRPTGKNRRPLKKWDPTKWEPVYDYIVVLSSSGKSNTEIASLTGYGPQQISNILTSQRGVQAKLQIIKLTRDKLTGTLVDRANTVADLTLKRIHALLNNDDLSEARQIQAIDRGLAASKIFIPESPKAPSQPTAINQGTIVQGNAIMIAPGGVVPMDGKLISQIREGLDKLHEVKQLHAPK